MHNYEKVQQLLHSRQLDNIELALNLAEAAGLNIIQPYFKLWNWLKAYGLLLTEDRPHEPAQLIYQLLRVKELSFGRQLLKPSYQNQRFLNYHFHKKRYQQSFYQFPSELQLLRALEVLEVINPRLRQLPHYMGQLSALRRLSIKTGQIQQLPVSLFLLLPLQHLQISWTPLSYIAPEIGQLRNLRVLDLSYNQLEYLPKTIASLTALRELNCAGNQLRELPGWLYQMPALRVLNLQENCIPEGELQSAYNFVQANAMRLDLEKATDQLEESWLLSHSTVTSQDWELYRLEQGYLPQPGWAEPAELPPPTEWEY